MNDEPGAPHAAPHRSPASSTDAPPAASARTSRPPPEPPPWTGLQRSPLTRAHTIALVTLLSVGAIALGVAGHSLYDEYVANSDRSSYVATLARARAAQSAPDATALPPASAIPGGPVAPPTPSLFSPDFIKGPQAALAAAQRPSTGERATYGTGTPPRDSAGDPTAYPDDPTVFGQFAADVPPPSAVIPGARADRTSRDTAQIARGMSGRASAHASGAGKRTAQTVAARRAAAERERRAAAIREARATRETRETRNQQQASADPLAGLRRILRTAWLHAPPQRNRLDSGPQYKGQ